MILVTDKYCPSYNTMRYIVPNLFEVQCGLNKIWSVSIDFSNSSWFEPRTYLNEIVSFIEWFRCMKSFETAW